MAKAIGTLGTIDSISIGGRVLTDTTTLILLWSQNAGGATQYSGLVKQGGSSGAYQVTTGKTYTFSAVRLQQGNTTGVEMDIGYGDTAAVFSTSTQPSTPVYTSSHTSTPRTQFYGGIVSGVLYEFAPVGQLAATKYGFIDCLGNASKASAWVYGYEA